MSNKPIQSVLLIEDNAGDARLFREMFSEQGSRNARLNHENCMGDAEKYLAAHEVDIILLDLGLPDVQGLEAVRRARSAAPHVPLVVLSGLDDESMAVQALQEGAQDYLIKGQIQSRELLRALRYAIERKSCEETLFAEKERAQVTVDSMEGRYRGLLEAAPDAMVVVNQLGEIVIVNVQAEKQFGYNRDELLAQQVKNIIPEGFAERLISDGIRTAAEALAQQIGTGIVLKGRRKDGSDFPIEIMLSPLESTEGILVTAAVRNISERKQLENQLHQSQKMEAIGQLTGGIAHDFNNLLGVIIGNLDLLDSLVADNETAIKRVHTALKAAMRGADITRRLLVFSSNEELKPSVTVLSDSIQNMIELAGRAIGAGIKITKQIDESMPPVFVDPAGLESALLNLVVNARDAMPKGGFITIDTKQCNLDLSFPTVQAGDIKAGQYACVSVSDTGHGMSQVVLERAFEPFFTTKTRNKGTGLGLAMVYGFARQSGGTVRIYSEVGHGTTVSFYLPLLADLPRPIPADSTKILAAKSGGTVLVVDDEEDLLEVAAAYLAEMGHTALQAMDGASALAMLADHKEINLMVTDIVIPGGMNGVELVQQVHALRPEIKIIYSSGFTANALAERSLTLMGCPLLHKPYQRGEFAAMIREVLEGSHASLGNETSPGPEKTLVAC